VDLRERIVAACDAKEGTREEVAKRFKVGGSNCPITPRNRHGVWLTETAGDEAESVTLLYSSTFRDTNNLRELFN
jgi:hypothetical protein